MGVAGAGEGLGDGDLGPLPWSTVGLRSPSHIPPPQIRGWSEAREHSGSPATSCPLVQVSFQVHQLNPGIPGPAIGGRGLPSFPAPLAKGAWGGGPKRLHHRGG